MIREYELMVATILQRPTEGKLLRQQIEDHKVTQRAVRVVSAIFAMMTLCFLYGIINHG